MNILISGGWWLVLILIIGALLFLVALTRRDKAKVVRRQGGSKKFSKSQKSIMDKPSVDILKLHKLVNRHFPHMNTSVRHNRIIVQSADDKQVMLTIDKKLKEGSRPLGDAVVVNFHRVPTIDTLKQALGTSKLS